MIGRALLLGVGLSSCVVFVAACGGAAASGAGAIGSSPPNVATDLSTASPSATVAASPLPPPIAPSKPDVELMTATNAIAFGERIEFDGIDEGLVWPKLAKAFEHAGGGASAAGAVVIQLERDVPIQTLLRAVFTMQARNLRVQSRDESGALHVVELNAKPAVAPAGRPCHLAVFLKPDGSIRVAAPGGSRDITAPKAADQLAQALQAEMPTCGIKYVAFGAESNDVPFGPVFDVMIAVDRVKAAGDARYVLGEAIHGAPPR